MLSAGFGQWCTVLWESILSQALGVLAAEVVGAAIASSIVGGITAKVPAKKELKV